MKLESVYRNLISFCIGLVLGNYVFLEKFMRVLYEYYDEKCVFVTTAKNTNQCSEFSFVFFNICIALDTLLLIVISVAVLDLFVNWQQPGHMLPATRSIMQHLRLLQPEENAVPFIPAGNSKMVVIVARHKQPGQPYENNELISSVAMAVSAMQRTTPYAVTAWARQQNQPMLYQVNISADIDNFIHRLLVSGVNGAKPVIKIEDEICAVAAFVPDNYNVRLPKLII